MSVQLLRGNALHLPLADDSVDLVVTSPPYFALRSYTDGGEHYDGQIGSEPTPAEFVDALIAATAEMVRVAKQSGSIWVNLGDKYVSDNRGSGTDTKRKEAKWAPPGDRGYVGEGIMPRKSLMGLPWRYAIRCIDDLGLILRAEVIWSKPNGLPESVTDRVRRSHEQWFHFTLRPRYYSAIDEIREPHTGNAHGGRKDGSHPPGGKQQRQVETGQRGGTLGATNLDLFDPRGKLPGSVWSIPSQPLAVPKHLGVDHFAAFPMEWPRRIIRGWSPAAICTTCGEGRRPVVETVQELYRQAGSTGRPKSQDLSGTHSNGRNGIGYPQTRATTSIEGYQCACPDTTAPARPGVVLDPFGGTGTTALVAHALGRHGISVDMSADYCRLATWRTTDPGQLAAALQVDKPAPVAQGQAHLFEVIA